MIRKTIAHTKECTFIVHTPVKNFPHPTGTGFFISKEGYFITANHVIDKVEDFSKVRFSQPEGAQLLSVSPIKKWVNHDIALLKADFDANKKRKIEFLKNKEGFPYLETDFQAQLEGTPIYAYGFPLPKVTKVEKGGLMLGFIGYCPRITSAIISSEYDIFRPIRGSKDLKFYAIDKTLFYGNSGGPIIITETGKVFAVAVRFQPVTIPQYPNSRVIIPTNYGIVSSLSNIANFLKDELNI